MALLPWRSILLLVCVTAPAITPGTAGAREPALLFAHRGGALEFDENSLRGFGSCYERGLRGFETDVRMTQDGELVILHDDSLDRTHQGSGPVEQKSASELRGIVSKQGEPLLFLDELLAYFADKPGVYLELEMKTGNRTLYPDDRLRTYCEKLRDAAFARRPEGSSYVFTSADERTLRMMRQVEPDADMLYIINAPCSAQAVAKAQELGAKRLGVRMDRSSRESVRQAQDAGLIVSGWPGRTLADYHLGVGLGLDAICCDVPVAVQAWKDVHEPRAK